MSEGQDTVPLGGVHGESLAPAGPGRGGQASAAFRVAAAAARVFSLWLPQ